MGILTRARIAPPVILAGLIMLAGAIAGSSGLPVAHGSPDDGHNLDLTESAVRFTDGDTVHEIRIFMVDSSGDEASVALDSVMASRGYPEPDSDRVGAAFATFAHWLPEQMPVVVEYHSGSDPAGLSLYSPILYSIDRWNEVEASWFRFAYGGEVDRETCIFDTSTDALKTGPNFDGHNVVSFGSFAGLGPFSSRILGITCSSWNVDTGEFYEFDMELSATQPWSMYGNTPENRYDLYTTVLHEFGHALGLSHTTDRTAVMQPSARKGDPLRELTQDDIDGVLSLYFDPDYVPPPQAQRGDYRLLVGGLRGGAGIPQE